MGQRHNIDACRCQSIALPVFKTLHCSVRITDGSARLAVTLILFTVGTSDQTGPSKKQILTEAACGYKRFLTNLLVWSCACCGAMCTKVFVVLYIVHIRNLHCRDMSYTSWMELIHLLVREKPISSESLQVQECGRPTSIVCTDADCLGPYPYTYTRAPQKRPPQLPM